MAAITNPENFSENEPEFSEPDFNIKPIHTKISPIIRAVERLIAAIDGPVRVYFEKILSKFQKRYGELSPSDDEDDEDFSLECYGIISTLNNGICDGARAIAENIPYLYGSLFGFIGQVHKLCRVAIVEYDYLCGSCEWYDSPPPIVGQDLSYSDERTDPRQRHLPIFDDELDYFDPLAVLLRNLSESSDYYMSHRIMDRINARLNIHRDTPAHARPADQDDNDDGWNPKKPGDSKRRKDDFFF